MEICKLFLFLFIVQFPALNEKNSAETQGHIGWGIEAGQGKGPWGHTLISI
jgi:hypothetical protein